MRNGNRFWQNICLTASFGILSVASFSAHAAEVDKYLNRYASMVKDAEQYRFARKPLPSYEKTIPVSLNSNLPVSARSARVVTQQSPALRAQLAGHGMQLGNPVLIRLFKDPGVLELWVQRQDSFKLFKTYRICRYSGGLGPKLVEGDRQSPEGFYNITPRRLNPNSSYFLSFDLGYPNEYDKAHGRTGAALMIHGDCVSVGCYAMTDAMISEIYTVVHAALEHGQLQVQVQAYPFRLDNRNMARINSSKWKDFWLNLKQGYDYFEIYKKPVNVSVIGMRYAFSAPLDNTIQTGSAANNLLGANTNN